MERRSRSAQQEVRKTNAKISPSMSCLYNLSMPLQRPTRPNRRRCGDSAANDHETDRLNRTEAAIRWIQARAASFSGSRLGNPKIEPFRAGQRSGSR
jgi:hypothetical protein